MRHSLLFIALLLASGAVHAQNQPAPGEVEQPTKANEAESADDTDAIETSSSKVPLEEIRRYVNVYNAVKEAYVDSVNDKKLMSSAIKGLLLDLDPHSTYFEKEDAEAFDEDTSGEYQGIGVEVQSQKDGTLKVIAPIDDAPAAKAGIKAGDLIVEVDGKPLTNSNRETEGSPLRGKPGTSVKLTIIRKGESKPLTIDVTREIIRVASVRSRMLEPGYGYIRVSQFQADTATQFEEKLAALKAEAGGKLKGLVLDLRSNPGGLLTSAVQMADALLDKGKIVSTRGRIGVSDAEFNATPGDSLDGTPIVLIVDAGSASASEVLAGALRDNQRARIIGSQTFGKGSVQTLLPLDNGDSIKLTTARYYTPSGQSIQARGIQPDVVLKPDGKTAQFSGYSEANLPGHLRGEDEDEGSKGGDVLPGDAPITAALKELKAPTPLTPIGVKKAAAGKESQEKTATSKPESRNAEQAQPQSEPKPADITPANPPSAEPAQSKPADDKREDKQAAPVENDDAP